MGIVGREHVVSHGTGGRYKTGRKPQAIDKDVMTLGSSGLGNGLSGGHHDEVIRS